MKLNKTLMITALVAGGLFTVVAVQAQDSTNTPTTPTHPPGGPRPGGRPNLEFLAKQLALTDDQKTKAKPVFEEMFQKQTDIRKDTTMAIADKRAKMKEIHDDATTKLKAIFTPEQFEKWQKMGPGNRRPPGGPGAPPPAGGATPPPATPPPAGGAQ